MQGSLGSSFVTGEIANKEVTKNLTEWQTRRGLPRKKGKERRKEYRKNIVRIDVGVGSLDKKKRHSNSAVKRRVILGEGGHYRRRPRWTGIALGIRGDTQGIDQGGEKSRRHSGEKNVFQIGEATNGFREK